MEALRKTQIAPETGPPENVGFTLAQAADGRLVLKRSDNSTVAVSVRRCFPWSRPTSWLSLRDAEGRGVELVEDAFQLDANSRGALIHALAEASFVFRIEAIVSVEEEFELRIWRVRLREGERIFQTRLMSWPRDLGGGGLLIQDVGNDLYVIDDMEALDAGSKKILWAYLDD